MRILQKTKDGGKESTVDAYFLIELKGLFSIALLKFNKGSRNNFHNHAFNAWTWFLKGDMIEHDISGEEKVYKRSMLPKITKRDNFHKVVANETSWCLTFRGKWNEPWKEYNPRTCETITLTHGRKVIERV